MTTSQLETAIRQQPGVTVIDLSGDINAFSEDLLNAAYAEAADENPSTILLNFGD